MINTDFTYEEAIQLLRTPKVIIEGDGSACEKKVLDIVDGFAETLTLMSENGKVFFKWTIRQSPKELIKLSLNVIDKDSNIGVFRVDYVAPNVRHQNPMEMTDDVPECLKPYCGIEI